MLKREESMSILRRDIRDIKKTQVLPQEIKTTVSRIKNTSKGTDNRLDQEE